MDVDALNSSNLVLDFLNNADLASPLAKRRRAVRKPDDDINYEPADIERAVSEAITGCKYTEEERKERLRIAVLDALFKRRTMKSSSQHHGVPFTTLQTYFHRSKQILANEAKHQPLLESFQDQSSCLISPEPKTPSPGSKLEDVLYRLTATADVISNDASAINDCPHPTGSNKRKPKIVRRVVEPEAIEFSNGLEDKYVYQPDTSGIFQQALLSQLWVVNGNMDLSSSGDCGDGAAENGGFAVPPVSAEVRDQFLNYIASMNNFNEGMKKELQGSLLDDDESLSKLLGSAADGVVLENPSFLSDLSESLEENEKGSVTGSNSDSKKSDKDYVYGPPIDPDDTERMLAIEQGVKDICASSIVVRGELTINAASNMMQLPSSTVHPYVHRARSALGALLPPQASGPTFWTAMKAHEKAIVPAQYDAPSDQVNGCIDSEKLDKLVVELVRTSLYDACGKQKLKDAVVKS
uniref:HTH psq-type domain-containing protein n=1 Tax=Syphacia muris TaxID=451379 RepID=A0A0N5ATE8_9BILA